jgi:hypothetical protein
MGDSILTALVDKKIKVLYTTKFKTGDYSAEDIRSKNSKIIKQQQTQAMKKLLPEIEQEESPNIKDVKTILLNMNTKDADPFADPAGKKSQFLDSLTFNNNNTMCCYKKNLILL